MSELEHRPVPPVGEEVHMPEPSLIPIVNAAALANVTHPPVCSFSVNTLGTSEPAHWRRAYDGLPGPAKT